jgi:FAD-dependent urate hydroxylase
VTDCEVAIVGAGPYGLSLAANLGDLDTRVFGRPMSFWREHMPVGMKLRSPRAASNLSAPDWAFRLDDFEREHHLPAEAPLPLSTFVKYGMWFQEQAACNLDERPVVRIEPNDGDFRLTLEDGEQLEAARVVVAAGIGSFARRPNEFSALPSHRVSHTVDHSDLRTFATRRVAVIGAGQSAIESAALIAESGGEVEVIARTQSINWLLRSSNLHRLGSLRRLLYGPSDIGPAGVSWLVEWPRVISRIPRSILEPMAGRAIRPAASAWLVPRVADVNMSLGRSVSSCVEKQGVVELSLDDGTSRQVDHVLLATGYQVDIARYDFLAPSLLERIDRVGGFPRLGRGFQSSIPNLHFIGAPAAWSYGPLFRFVAGAGYSANALKDLWSKRSETCPPLRRVVTDYPPNS